MMTKSDAQFLLSGIRKSITVIETNIGMVKQQNRDLYQAAEPDTVEGMMAFARLNTNRDWIRLAKRDIKRLARIAKNLKEFIRA